jgi:putative thioredoxin
MSSAEPPWAEALEGQLLEIVRRDRTFQDDIGRKRMIQGLRTRRGPAGQLVSEWRRKLSSSLY